MPTDSRTYSEKEVEALVKAHIEQTERREVKSVSFTYDRPSHPTPLDPGSGLSMRVELGEGFTTDKEQRP